ncbi:MAG: 50S ribosomal protein L3 [Acetothermia bacterium 64_32]|nr:MAG: 50S ribosomal protein L3 [Acetothermia bacterium 64_32]MBC7097758.1 50S ribosomal protein L3 [Candidatus Bipolaricaulota bacterium]HAF70231.1 50S ribosomal protein L3 [Candidatus Acetothermia bacterium]
MTLCLLGKKVGMTQWFDGHGGAVAATVIQVEPSVVVQLKRPETDGYAAVQLGWGEVKEKRLPKPLQGHFRKAGVPPRRRLYEARVEDPDAFQVGQTLGVEAFSEGELVDVTGISKGRGFSGTIKRWGFGYRPRSHGHKLIRRPGTAGPMGLRKVMKGKKMPGHFGAQAVTVRNLRVLKVDVERGLLVLQGSVPGPRKGVVKIRKHDA